MAWVSLGASSGLVSRILKGVKGLESWRVVRRCLHHCLHRLVDGWIAGGGSKRRVEVEVPQSHGLASLAVGFGAAEQVLTGLLTVLAACLKVQR